MNQNLDYADVIDALDYTQGLEEHVDIPQSDAGIIRLIAENARRVENFLVLDLGCGPGRLTQRIGKEIDAQAGSTVVGLDISSSFISFAKQHRNHTNVEYLETDFLTHNFSSKKFNVILMQGLVHHVPKQDRKAWLLKCKELLAPEGIVIIGDEFIPDYNTEEERVRNVVGLYAYVIANGLRCGHASLADIESKNMVDDVASGLKGAGHSDDTLLGYIKEKSSEIYSMVFENGTRNDAYLPRLQEIADYIKQRSAEIAELSTETHDRGDYKISVEKQIEEMEGLGFKSIVVKKYGPIDWLGGMAVLAFEIA